jgi:catechol 2,3-dioxygenase-like lactoylglutathione lyase family enzyme
VVVSSTTCICAWRIFPFQSGSTARCSSRSAARRESSEGDDFFNSDELWIDQADGPVSRVHLAFQADSLAQVQAFHAAALRAGGRDNGAPGERSYHPGYYAAFVFDPDGNNIEAVHHGPAKKSAESIVITPTGG